jgi:hypothetical protein
LAAEYLNIVYSYCFFLAAPNIRLTYEHVGYIEIKHGSIWMKVVEKNWDKKRENMLCQHLGFQADEGSQGNSFGYSRKVQVATGDLICYTRTSKGTSSCCIHLERSKYTATTLFPYVRC